MNTIYFKTVLSKLHINQLNREKKCLIKAYSWIQEHFYIRGAMIRQMRIVIYCDILRYRKPVLQYIVRYIFYLQGSRSPDFGAEIRPHSQCQKVCFFPNSRRKIPNLTKPQT